MWIRPVLRVVAALSLILVVCLVLSPTGRYLLRAAIRRGEDPGPAHSDQRGSPPTRPRLCTLKSKLVLVLAARAFARDSLGLRTGQSFTTYSALDRDTLVLVLSGAYRDRLKSYTWWFPIVGRVPYKGYFDFDEARRQERALIARGFDAHLGSASAFSTLGWFNDPLLPTTLALRLADACKYRHTRAHAQHLLRTGRRGLQ